jgi:hypothetical protein
MFQAIFGTVLAAVDIIGLVGQIILDHKNIMRPS